ncbi:hypothetical protein ACIGO8_03840 [Streptomyces sp. NPDC053493]|uniref:hypothetical protein n=1 Tax=Streptomyces sp. NPDC053493 TaxID=3365705 RepID=UPI0037D7AC7C
MVYYDPTNDIVASSCLQTPVVFQHRLSGSYLAQAGDLQLKQDPLTGDQTHDAPALWMLEAYMITDDGVVTYRIQNVSTKKVMAIPFDPANPQNAPINQGIVFPDPTPDKDSNTLAALSQLWVFQPVADRSHIISPARFTELSLAPYTNNPATTSGCDRIPPVILPNGGDNDCWLHHHRIRQYPKPAKDPACHANCKNC